MRPNRFLRALTTAVERAESMPALLGSASLVVLRAVARRRGALAG